jgi:multicomponent Na+:H+ antiporter subunit C
VSAAFATGALAAAGIFLLVQRDLVRRVIGFLLLQHAVNLLLVTARAPGREAGPILPTRGAADPLGQAFVLTAIVIGFAATLFLLALALRRAKLAEEENSGGSQAPRGTATAESQRPLASRDADAPPD